MATRSTRLLGLGMASALALLPGCSGFFVPVVPVSPTPTPGTSNYLFAVNPGLQTVSTFGIGASTLTLAAGSPVSLPANLILPTAPSAAVAVSRNNGFVYVGGLNAIYCYSVASTGALSLVSSSSVTTAANVIAMDTSPDGQWLFALDAASQSVFEFSTNPTTGALGTLTQVVYNVPTSVLNNPRSIRATATLVVAAIGTGGDALFTLNTTTGALVATATLLINNPLQSDNDIAITPNGSFLFVARSGVVGATPANGVAAYQVAATGIPATIGSGALAPAGNGASSILLDSTNSHLYVANRSDATISEYAISAAGVVSALSTPSIPAGQTITSLARDSTGKYVFAGEIGSTADLQMFTFDAVTPGKLDLATSASSGADTYGLQIATTH